MEANNSREFHPAPNSIHRTYTVCLVEHGETWVFLFDANHVSETLQLLGRFADNEDLNFSWYDAARASRAVRQAARSRTR